MTARFTFCLCVIFSSIFLSIRGQAQEKSSFAQAYQTLFTKERYAKANKLLDSVLASGVVGEQAYLDLYLKKASLYSLLKVHDSALFYLEKTVEKAKLANDTDIMNRANTNLGILLNQIGRPKEALAKYKKHYDFVKTLPETKSGLKRQMISNYNLGLTYFRLMALDSSKLFLNASLMQADLIADYKAKAKIQGLLSEVNFTSGDAWENELNQAYQASLQINDTVGLLKASLTAAEFNFEVGNLKQSRLELNEANQFLPKVPDNISLWLNFYDLNYKISKYTKDFKQSIYYLELYNSKKQELDALQKADAVNIYNERLKIYEKNLKNSKLLVQQKQKINKLTLGVAILGFIVVLSFSLIFLRSNLIRWNKKLFKVNQLSEDNLSLSNKKESDVNKKLYSEIQQKITEEQLYLDPNINLATLAKSVNSNSNYVSEAINQFSSSNFSMYINKKRIEFAKAKISKLACEEAYLSFDDIASQSGFNSKSHFYRVFKQITELTPRQYLMFSKDSTLTRKDE